MNVDDGAGYADELRHNKRSTLGLIEPVHGSSRERSTNKCDNDHIVVKEQAGPVSKSLEDAKGHHRSRNRYERIRHVIERLTRVADRHMANGRGDI